MNFEICFNLGKYHLSIKFKCFNSQVSCLVSIDTVQAKYEQLQ